jgi:hypothetical protein
MKSQVSATSHESTTVESPESDEAPRQLYAHPELIRLGTVSDLTEGVTKGGILPDTGGGASFIPPG